MNLPTGLDAATRSRFISRIIESCRVSTRFSSQRRFCTGDEFMHTLHQGFTCSRYRGACSILQRSQRLCSMVYNNMVVPMRGIASWLRLHAYRIKWIPDRGFRVFEFTMFVPRSGSCSLSLSLSLVFFSVSLNVIALLRLDYTRLKILIN